MYVSKDIYEYIDSHTHTHTHIWGNESESDAM